MKIADDAWVAPYPPIDPPDRSGRRPFWSVMIPVYNCAPLLRRTLRSVLTQCPPGTDMQIEVIDDCSTRDDPKQIVEECGEGRVAFYRHPSNVGPQANFTACVRRAHGEWVHVLHGDDMVAPDFYRTFTSIARSRPSLGAVFCRVTNIDADDRPIDLSTLEMAEGGIHERVLERLAVENIIMFPSIVVRRAIYEKVGGFHPELFHAADWDMWKRVAMSAPVWYEPRALAMYRIHQQSDTSHLMQSGANIADARHAIAVSRAYLPHDHAAAWSQQALEHHGLYALELAQQMIERRSWRAAAAQVRQALLCSRSPRVLSALVSLRLNPTRHLSNA